MGLISAKETKNNNNNTRGAMGLLLVFFPDHHNNNNDDSPSFSPSSSSSSSPAATTTLFRTRSSRLLLSKAQSTISICILLLFLTLFLFTLSTFEPSSGFPSVSSRPHRRFLLNRDIVGSHPFRRRYDRFALQGMGTLFLRGTRSMQGLIVAHLASDATDDDLRLFMRLLHRSGVISKSDVVLLFNSPSSRFAGLIEEENDSFLKLVDVHRSSNSSTNQTDSVWGFNLTKFMKKTSSSSSSPEPIWGKKTHRASNDSSLINNSTESSELTHGSVVGFDVTELDPENSLSGFMDHVPISLRRWACYPMLLGRVRRNFKHVMLVDAKTSLFLGDPFTRIRNRSPESVLFFSSKHSSSKKSSDVNPAILVGGAKGIRRLSSSMHTEIVRAAMQQQQHKNKKKSSVTDSVVLSQLVGNVHMVKNFEVVTSESAVPEASSLAELRTRNSAASSIKNHDIIQRGNANGNGNSNHITDIIMKRICSCELDSSVYNYC
ncbi:PREDICTED: uncharacterized protein LOC104712410 [Camelina sativa]|uniref:Uncharacterized protein LOC104712410 n=1 Tax=Camelina sativa TaxID=90675 RepID=A0ABM0TK73_CAMSA|nr:PREDICTED: uncharacterized protein LOC104712410 [Camelina sativa]